MKRNILYIMAAVLAMLPILASCRQELCYDHYPAMDIKFQWEQEWERDYGEYHFNNWSKEHYGWDYDELRPDKPEWVNMIRYFSDGVNNERFLTPEGQVMEVEEGKDCSILFYNGDTEFLVLSDIASLNDARAEATSRSRTRTSLSAMYEVYEDTRTTNPPDILYSAFIDNVDGLKNHDLKDMPVKMQPLVFTYIIRYEFEYGIHNVALARGAIGGMAESVYLRSGVTSEESSIILFDCDITSTGCRTSVRSFGIPGFPDAYYGRKEAKSDRIYTLNLELKLKNGKTEIFDYDITDQMKNQPRGGVITISGIRIEDVPDKPDSMFDVEVIDWDDDGEIINIPSLS